MSGEPTRIDRLDLIVPGTGAEDGRRFGAAVSGALEQALAGAASGHIGQLEIRVTAGADPDAVARAIRAAVRRSAR